MSVYTNAECPYCKKTINGDDELVVCPTCGTPHHRSCYFENGHCFNEERHAEGFEWTPPATAAIQSGETLACSNCGKSISKDSVFCNYCGTPINPHITDGGGGTMSPVPQNGMLFAVGDEQPVYNMAEEIDDISIKDWITYIGQNFNYYLLNFKAQDKMKRKTAMTFSAVLFPFIYFLYRRVWGAAIVSAISNLILNIPYMVIMVFLPSGIDFGIGQLTWQRMSSVCSILGIVINLAWGLFAVWLYRKKAVRHIGRLKSESASEEEYARRLQRVSGPSRTAIMVLVIVFVASLLFSAVYSGFSGLSI